MGGKHVNGRRLVATLMWLWRLRRERSERWVTEAVSLLVLVLMLSSKKTYPDYTIPVLLPLTIILVQAAPARHLDPAPWILLWSCAATLEPSLWARWIDRRSVLETLVTHGLGPVETAKCLAFLSVEAIVISGYAVASMVLARRLQSAASAPHSQGVP